MKNDTPYDYPLLETLEKYFVSQLTSHEKEKLHDVTIVACQHLLEPQLKMFEAMIRLGIPAEHIHVMGKIYSTNFDILKELQDMEIDATQPTFVNSKSFDTQHAENCITFYENVTKNISGQVVVLDDGAQLLHIVLEKNESNVAGVEQTSSGFRKLENIEIKFPIINVARSSIKLIQETPFIVELGVQRLEEEITKWKLQKPKVLIIGQGPIGLEMYNQLKERYEVETYDKLQGTYNPVELILHTQPDIIVGATGSQILTHEQLIEINSQYKKKLYCISMSSSDREFELWRMRDLFKTGNVHDAVQYENIIILNNGFPITFKGNRIESQPHEMEKTIGLLFGSTIYAATKNIQQDGLMDVPDEIVRLLSFE